MTFPPLSVLMTGMSVFFRKLLFESDIPKVKTGWCSKNHTSSLSSFPLDKTMFIIDDQVSTKSCLPSSLIFNSPLFKFSGFDISLFRDSMIIDNFLSVFRVGVINLCSHFISFYKFLHIIFRNFSKFDQNVFWKFP